MAKRTLYDENGGLVQEPLGDYKVPCDIEDPKYCTDHKCRICFEKVKTYKCSICSDTKCILHFESKDITTKPNRCPHWMGIAKWQLYEKEDIQLNDKPKIDPYYMKQAKHIVDMLYDKEFLSKDISRDSMDDLEEFIGFMIHSHCDMAAKAALLTKKAKGD